MADSAELKLRTWVWSQRARALQGLNRFDEALQCLDEEIAIHEHHDVDQWNSPTAWAVKADIYELLWRPDEEGEARREALRRAIACGNNTLATLYASGLASLCVHLQDPVGSSRWLLEAFRYARTRLGDQATSSDRLSARGTIQVAINLLGPRSARLAATLEEQHRSLVVPEGAEGQLDVLIRQIGALAEAGDRARFWSVWTQARSLAEGIFQIASGLSMHRSWRTRWKSESRSVGWSSCHRFLPTRMSTAITGRWGPLDSTGRWPAYLRGRSMRGWC